MAPHRQFFEVSAQVIPLLMLVGLIEHRGISVPERTTGSRHRLNREERSLLLMRLLAMALVVIGEVAALSALAGEPTPTYAALVRGGLATAAYFVVDRFLDGEFERLNTTMRRPLRLAVILVFSLVVLGTIAFSSVASLVP